MQKMPKGTRCNLEKGCGMKVIGIFMPRCSQKHKKGKVSHFLNVCEESKSPRTLMIT